MVMMATARKRTRDLVWHSKDLVSEISSILIFGIAIFTLIAILTYHPSDPSLFSHTAALPANACGRVGAYLSSLFLQTLGIGAFLVPAALFFLSAAVFHREGLVRFLGIFSGMSVSVVALTVFLTLQWQIWSYAGTELLTGGALGVWIAEALKGPLNPFGASLASLLVFTLAIVLSTPVSVAQIGARFFRWSFDTCFGILKVIGGYLFYLGGLLLMRFAHATGDLIYRFMEATMERARERAMAFTQMRIARQEARKEIAVDSEVEPKAVLTAGVLGSKPDIESDVESDSRQEDEYAYEEDESEAGEEEDECVYEDEEGQEEEEEEGGGAPNALKASPSQHPEIMPFEQHETKPAKQSKRPARVGNWKLPAVEFLNKVPKVDAAIDKDRLIQNSEILRQKLADFGVHGEVTAVRPGPVITLYEFRPGPGVKVSKISALADDLSMALSAESVRILAPLPGKSVVGIEIPSDKRETVFLREFLQHPDFYSDKRLLPVVMGKTISGQAHFADLAKMPHLLCAGQTGAGKSVFMNGLICSLLYRYTPEDLRLILVDPKFIEFRSYQDIPHLLLPVVDDPKEASTALKWAVREMERRYRILAMLGAKNLASYNEKVKKMGVDVVRDLLYSEENQTARMNKMSGGDWEKAFEMDEDGYACVGKLPYIVIIIDELADLMMVAKKDVEISIARIAQKARAAGLHLVIATQRPSTDVVTGLIKANLPSRASFQLASGVDSKTILDRVGAERLLGQGDMLFIPPGTSQLLRLHGAFVDDDEINKITAFLCAQGEPDYRDEILTEDDEEEESQNQENEDELFEEAVNLIRSSQSASASFLQRHLKVGYNRAARIIEEMEARGIVGPADGSRPREVLIR
jgi:DNA segregation ATPase FtsK/SpoIIIE, S-DNA-T family